MNEITNNTANQTPIEIALGIDEEGYTTARALYEFLSGEKSHFARWAKKISKKMNILRKMLTGGGSPPWRTVMNAGITALLRILQSTFRWKVIQPKEDCAPVFP